MNRLRVFSFFVCLVCCFFCFSVQADNFSLVRGYKLLLNKTEIGIQQAEESQPLLEYKVNINMSNNSVVIKDTSHKAMVFSVVSEGNNQVLELFKKDCLDNLANANCLDEFIERFYTLFDPFGLEYSFFSEGNLIQAKLVKEDKIDEKFARISTGILYLHESDVLIGTVKIYEISSGQEVLSEKLNYGQNSLDISCLRNGAYVLIYNKKSLKFVL